MFRLANTAKTLMTRRFSSGVHHPFALKVKGRIPESAGVEDMATKLWRVNPGLVIVLSGFGAFVAGVGVHDISKWTSFNSSIEKAMFEEAAAKKA